MAVRIEGLNKALRDLQSLGAEVDDLKDVMEAIADEGSKVMAGFVPRGSGALAATVRGNRAKGKAVITAGRGRVRYAGPINYGWPRRNIAAADFTGKTDEVMETKAVQMLDQGITDLIRRKGLA